MPEALFEEEAFNRISGGLQPGLYENCTFTQCDFTAGNLQHSRFLSCRFDSCNLSLALISGSSFRDVRFDGCKMLGLRFDQCRGFGLDATFTDCILDQSVFHKVPMPATKMNGCSVAEADFSAADLHETIFANCDLRGSDFTGADLRKADFRTARAYRIDPDRTKLKGATFSMPEVLSLLDKYGLKIEH